jgi:hypothetical protein
MCVCARRYCRRVPEVIACSRLHAQFGIVVPSPGGRPPQVGTSRAFRARSLSASSGHYTPDTRCVEPDLAIGRSYRRLRRDQEDARATPSRGNPRRVAQDERSHLAFHLRVMPRRRRGHSVQARHRQPIGVEMERYELGVALALAELVQLRRQASRRRQVHQMTGSTAIQRSKRAPGWPRPSPSGGTARPHAARR